MSVGLSMGEENRKRKLFWDQRRWWRHFIYNISSFFPLTLKDFEAEKQKRKELLKRPYSQITVEFLKSFRSKPLNAKITKFFCVF
jgi:hypothetical protein